MEPRKASLPLHIVIVGSGIAGLSTAICLGRAGHKVTVLERTSKISEIGAGIQLGPNMSRLLTRWGLGDRLKETAVQPRYLSFCRWSTGEKLGFAWFGEKMEEDHGAPYLHIHRHDLQQMLLDHATPYMTLELGCKVASIDPDTPSVTLESGRTISADLIIGADGAYSTVRESVCPEYQARETLDVAYRAVISVEEMKKDPELRLLVEPPQVHCWMGPGAHIVSYCISGGKEYNLVMVVPEDNSIASWTARGDINKVRGILSGWEPRIQKLLSLASSVLQTKITVASPLKRWVHPSNRVALIGDASHPLLPYRAQAAAMAVEDAAVLGNLLSRLSNKNQLPLLLHAYQEIRMPRISATLADTWMNRRIFHLPDGPEQESRDMRMKVAMEYALGTTRNSSENKSDVNQWADKHMNAEQFSYDAERAAEVWWNRRLALDDARMARL